MTGSSFLIPPVHVSPGIFLYPLDPLYCCPGFEHCPAGIGSSPFITHSPFERM